VVVLRSRRACSGKTDNGCLLAAKHALARSGWTPIETRRWERLVTLRRRTNAPDSTPTESAVTRIFNIDVVFDRKRDRIVGRQVEFARLNQDLRPVRVPETSRRRGGRKIRRHRMFADGRPARCRPAVMRAAVPKRVWPSKGRPPAIRATNPFASTGALLHPCGITEGAVTRPATASAIEM